MGSNRTDALPKQTTQLWIQSWPAASPGADGANQVWSYDFVFDWCANGQKVSCLTVSDEWTREGLAIEG